MRCCGILQKKSGYYYIDHKLRGLLKVFYTTCFNCDRPILKLTSGLLGGHIEQLNGKKAVRFLEEYPIQKCTIKHYKIPKIDNAKGYTYLEGKDQTIRRLGNDTIIDYFKTETHIYLNRQT